MAGKTDHHAASEHVEIFLPRRKRENFIFGKANFAVGCGRSGVPSTRDNAAENKIFRLQPGKEKLNMLSVVFF